MTDTTDPPAEQPRDLERFLGDQIRRVFDAELELVHTESIGTEKQPHWRAECNADSWTAHGSVEADLTAAVRTHISQQHPAGQLAFGMFALLRRYHAAHSAAEQGVGTPLATAQTLSLRAFNRALRAVASGFADQDDYKLAWTAQ
jgi:hypothetical protein